MTCRGQEDGSCWCWWRGSWAGRWATSAQWGGVRSVGWNTEMSALRSAFVITRLSTAPGELCAFFNQLKDQGSIDAKTYWTFMTVCLLFVK